jgi:hypothetical protein
VGGRQAVENHPGWTSSSVAFNLAQEAAAAWRGLYTDRAMLVGLLFIGLASISWGTTGATMALLARGSNLGPLTVGWARVAVAAPCLMLAAVSVERLAAPPPGNRAGRSRTWATAELPSA